MIYASDKRAHGPILGALDYIQESYVFARTLVRVKIAADNAHSSAVVGVIHLTNFSPALCCLESAGPALTRTAT